MVGDRWNDNNAYPRAEAMVKEGINTVEYGIEYLFEMNASFDGQVVNSAEMLGPFQVHHDGGGTIPLAMYFTGGGLKLCVRKNLTSPRWYTLLARVEENKPYSFRIEMKGDKNNAGYVRVFIDGFLKCEHVGQVGYAEANRARVGYPKFGLYDYHNTVADRMGMNCDGLKWSKRERNA